jgi:hypothetical protein
MKRAITFGLAAILATAGPALADQPMVLTGSQLDQVTAGAVDISRTLPGPEGKAAATSLLIQVDAPSAGASGMRPPEFVIISIGQEVNHALPALQR